LRIPILGLEVTRAPKSTALVPTEGAGEVVAEQKDMLPPGASWTGPGGWTSWFANIIREPFTGAWQRNMDMRVENVSTFHAVYACITLIASDISKMRLRLMKQDAATAIWSETASPSFSPVLTKPNRYQTRIKFFEQWIVSKLIQGNTYVLLERDRRNVVVAMYILDPNRTKPFVAPDGAVYYRLQRDNLSGILQDEKWVPASEIIHDVMVPLFHPLCGVSPLTACGLAAVHGLAIQRNSAQFFANGAKPGGVLTAPGFINQETADRVKALWEANYTGVNAGRVAVLGDGLKYEQMAVNAVDSQLIEQLKWSAEIVCSCFHVPAYMIGAGAQPNYSNIETLNQQYYTQCLQHLIENIELLLDEGLGLNAPSAPNQIMGTEFDVDDLLRMDTSTKAKAITDLTSHGLMKIDEGRAKFDLPPIPGGNAAYLQQQNYSLEALSKRDAKPDPFAPAGGGGGGNSSGGQGDPTPQADDGTNAAPAPTPGGKQLLALAIASKMAMRNAAYARYG